MNIRRTRLLPLASLMANLLLLPACGDKPYGDKPSGDKPSGTPRDGAGAQANGGLEIPNPDTRGMEAKVRRRIAEARRAVEAKATSASAWGRFGMVADVHELDEVALACYRKAQQLEPTDSRWPYLRARLLTVQGTDLATGVRLFEKALELDPDYGPGHLRLADALAQKGDLQAAETAYRRALELHPNLARAHLGLGQVLLRQGNATAAAKALERANGLEPADAAALAALSQAYRRLGRREEAVEAAREAALREPVGAFEDPLLQEVSAEGISSTLLVERALEYLRTERFREALANLLLAEEARPDDPYMQRNLGKAYQGVDDPNAAAKHFEKALSLKPDLPEARVLLGLTLLRTGQVDGALSEFERAASLGELPGPAHNAWGSALAQQGRLGEALGHFEKALESNPENPQVLFNLGLASEAMGRREKAVEYYRRTMAIEPNPMARERLALLTGG